uniref:Uncharacterized protein n=1 Tax=Arundo donax TaxID=35708 RepID=A0A0A9AIY4_ARUDO
MRTQPRQPPELFT